MPAVRSARAERAERWYRWLLHAYPRQVRVELGNEMLEAFRDAWRATAPAGRVARMRFWRRALLDALGNGFAERRASWTSAPSGGRLPEQLRYDGMQALRTLVRQPRVTLLCVLVGAVGTAGVTGVYSVYRRLLHAPPAGVGTAGQLVRLTHSTANGTGTSFAYPDYQHFRRYTRQAVQLIAVGQGEADVTLGGVVDKAALEAVSHDYFRALGVALARGQSFPDSIQQAVVVSHDFWRLRLASDPRATSRVISINGVSFQIAGVAPPQFQGLSVRGQIPDLWIPLESLALVNPGNWNPRTRNDRWLGLYARLREPASAEPLKAELNGLNPQIEREYPRSPQGATIDVTRSLTLSAQGRRNFTAILRLLVLLIGLLQLLSCANLGNLLLARALARRRDLAVRAALGAARGRLVLPVLLEGGLLALLGGAVGLLGAQWIALTTVRLLNVNVATGLDLPIIVFALLTTLVTAAIMGSVPALVAAGTEVNRNLRGTGVASGTRAHGRLRAALMFVQVVLATVLLMVSGALVNGVRKLQSIDPGLDARGLYAITIDLSSRPMTDAARLAFYQQLGERVRAQPGLRNASWSNVIPFSNRERGGGFTVPGREPVEGAGSFDSGYNVVDAEFFAVTGTAVLQGRAFQPSDGAGGERVIVVNEALARKVWPGQNPIGQQIVRDPVQPPFRVVGVAANARYYRVDQEVQPFFFFPLPQSVQKDMSLLVRSELDQLALASAVRATLGELDGQLSPGRLQSVELLAEHQSAGLRASASLSSAFGLLAFVLAAIGIFAVVSYNTGQRLSEIGIRMALGARPRAIIGVLTRPVLLSVALALVVGGWSALATVETITSTLQQVQSAEVEVIAAVALLVSVAALGASLLPALRALRLDPRRVLGGE